MDSIGLSLQNLILPNISGDLVTFYHDVVRKENDSNDVLANRKTLSRLRKMYSNKLRRDDPSSVCFDSVDVRSAYVFQYCPSFSLATASHFLALVKSLSQKQVQRLALRDTLSICCVGGGPGTEVVAICRVLQEVRRRCLPATEKPLRVHATVVDVEPGWSTTAKTVVDSCQTEFLDSSVVEIDSFRFVQHDFTGAVSEDIETVLGESDVVTLTKFLSALHGHKNLQSRLDILMDTWKHIPDGAILFLMDSSGWNHFDEMVRTISSFSQVELVYGPAKKTSRLSKTSKNHCVSLFSTIYGGRQCCTAQSSNKVAAWLKVSSVDEDRLDF